LAASKDKFSSLKLQIVNQKICQLILGCLFKNNTCTTSDQDEPKETRFAEEALQRTLFMACLGQLIGDYFLKIELSEVLVLKQLGFGEKCLSIENLHQEDMSRCIKALRNVDRADAKEIAEIVGGKTVDFNINDSTAWALMMEPLRNLKIIFVLQRYSPEFPDEVLTFYGKEIENITIPIDDLYDFTRLCVNALVRASGQPCEW